MELIHQESIVSFTAQQLRPDTFPTKQVLNCVIVHDDFHNNQPNAH